jgi:hypothetical protein
MASALLHAGHITEFVTDAITGTHYTGTCSQTALEVSMAALNGRVASTFYMAAWTRDMIAHKLCDSNGAATAANIARYARALGFHTPLEWDYAGDVMPHDWHSVLLRYAGVQPVWLQVSNGKALVDAETGSRDEADLHYHAIAVLDKQKNGYICADGDNPQVMSRFQIYNLNTLTAAKPCGLILLHN